MSDWGQGSKNNNIGWGQGAVNNSINWGAVHSESWSGDTDIVGINPNQAIINDFKARVLADGGTFEAEQCLKDSLPALIENEPPLAVTPNAKEAGKLFSIIPTDGSGDLDVVRATTATRVNSDGLIESVGANIPRLDYSNGSCPSILVEPQRTNLVLRSEEFNNASWIGFNGGLGSLPVVTANATTAPDGNLTADLVVFNINNGTSSADISQIQQNLTLTSSIYTFSIYAKSSDNITRVVNVVMPSGNIFNITITANWQRFTITDTTVGTGAIRLRLRGNESTAKIANLYLWGAQIEAGSNATSYIPTVASAVTRNADVISKTGISDLIGQTEGTVLCDINLTKLSESKALFVIDNGTTNEYINLIRVSTNIFRLSIKKTGTSAVNIIDSAVINDSRCRIAIAYKNGDYAMYVNGVQKGTSTNSTNYPTTALTQFVLSNASYGYLNDSFNASAIWKTRLTNAELEILTTI